MTKLAHLFSVYASWIAVPCLAIIGILFHKKQKTKESLIFASGIMLIAVGLLIQIFFPFGKITMDEAGKILSSSGPPLCWHTGNVIFSIGLIITVIGFALVTLKMKNTNT